MAHFARIENGIVTNVVVVDNEHEQQGEAYLNSLGLDGTWIQTSYNSNFRKKFAAIGDTYDEVEDVFKPAQPELTYVWDEGHWTWINPNPPAAPETTNASLN